MTCVTHHVSHGDWTRLRDVIYVKESNFIEVYMKKCTFFCFPFLQTLQKHYHPDVSKAAMLINTPLSEQEEDISEVLEITTYEVMCHF